MSMEQCTVLYHDDQAISGCCRPSRPLRCQLVVSSGSKAATVTIKRGSKVHLTLTVADVRSVKRGSDSHHLHASFGAARQCLVLEAPHEMVLGFANEEQANQWYDRLMTWWRMQADEGNVQQTEQSQLGVAADAVKVTARDHPTRPASTTTSTTAPLGVSIDCLHWLLDNVIHDPSLTAHDYCQHIKKLTQDQQCAFVDMANTLQQQQLKQHPASQSAISPTVSVPHPWAAPATNFISHTWSYAIRNHV
eukprot:m.214034 g.214034  ORF g.214034 m.214034 type:complete len:249 (+) comp17184_c0_seq16:223-969(+)